MFLDMLPIIFYFIAGIIAISYQILVNWYNLKSSKKTDIFAVCLVIFFSILSIVSSILFWYYY